MRNTKRKSLTLLGAAMTVGALGVATPALAENHEEQEGHGEYSFQAELGELNHSGASGTAWATLEGNELWIELETQGLLEGAPHAQHIHINGAGQCPDPNMEGTGVDGAIRTTDAIDDYGEVGTSLTTGDADTGPEHVLSVDNFPAGSGTYERSITVSDDVKENLENGTAVVVVHGVDHNGNGEYDGDQVSDLDESLPSEATDPALCGVLASSQMEEMPHGGVETGEGTTAGIDNGAALAAGGGLLAAGGLGLALMRRRETNASE